MAELNEYQRNILILTALGEARGQGVEGMADVLQTIFNRAQSGEFPSDPAAVALQELQYSTWNKGEGGNNPRQFKPTDAIYKKGEQALDAILSGKRPDYTGGALFYKTPDAVSPFHDRQEKYGTIVRNGHMYYPTRPVPPGSLPDVDVATLTDTKRPVPPSAPTPIPPMLNAQRNLQPLNPDVASIYAGMYPPPVPPAPITNNDLIRSTGIRDTVANSQAQQNPTLAAALEARIAASQRPPVPPMSTAAVSYAGQDRSPGRVVPPMPMGGRQSYAAAERAPAGRAVPPMPIGASQSYAAAERAPAGRAIPSMPTGVAQSFASAERAPVSRPVPPMPMSVAQSYGGQDRAPTRTTPVSVGSMGLPTLAPPAVPPRMTTAQVRADNGQGIPVPRGATPAQVAAVPYGASSTVGTIATSPRIGQPPATRTVASVPVRPSPMDTDLGTMPSWGDFQTAMAPPALPGPRAFPKGQEQLGSGAWGVPEIQVASALDVMPPIQVGLPPLPRPRPMQAAMPIGMPTPYSMRPQSVGMMANVPLPRARPSMPSAPMARPMFAMPTPVANRPAPRPLFNIMPTPSALRPTNRPPLEVVVQGAGTQQPSGGGGGGGSSSPSGYVHNGQQVYATPTQRYNTDTNSFETVTTYKSKK